MARSTTRSGGVALVARPGAGGREHRLVDALLTAPVFVLYHFGVVFLSVRNGLDPITDALLLIANRSLALYWGATALIGAALWAAARWSGAGGKLRAGWFVLRLLEAAIYAFGMWIVANVVTARALGALPHLAMRAASDGGSMLAVGPRGADPGTLVPPVAAFVMSLGAGLYEELAFRVILFGGGAWVATRLFGSGVRGAAVVIGWAVLAAAAFSAIHYVGNLGDDFRLASFVFRLTCGLFLTAVYRFRGFAAAVWTHALYDVAVMV